ncbi:MAG: hypothetical protein BZY79_00015 [SAR202 cluster bacterium Casp-Chloro-G4]|nr:MAG: hypothetical protein BZY79_00015 [SAR202 cluster bacterium Casp-Chloro-G4]
MAETRTPLGATATPELAVTATTKPEPNVASSLPDVNLRDPNERPPEFLQRQWKTDFSRHTVSYDEIMSGGPPRDGIPPIDNPMYASVANPPENMGANEPVIALEINGDARAYPLAILIWHEIVNDEVGGVPVSVTYCPLCNTAITFDRRVGEQVLDFGTSGMLRKSDLVMWDRQTESWWQQITGEAIVGELTGTKLTFIPAPLTSWKEFTEAYPDGQVLTRETGFSRNYNTPPYSGYDNLGGQPFLFGGAIDSKLPAMERVIGLDLGQEKVAYPFGGFSESPVVHDTVSGQDIVIFFADGTLSAFDGRGPEGRRTVGSTGVFSPTLDGRDLTFALQDGAIVDEQTGSEWNVLGQAVAGDLVGRSLAPVVHANHFWFAWQAFHPDTEVRTAEDIMR